MQLRWKRRRPVLAVLLAVGAASLAALAAAGEPPAPADPVPDSLSPAAAPVTAPAAARAPRHAHGESYASALAAASPDAASDWLGRAAAARTAAPLIEAPYHETGRFVRDHADARGYRITLHAGETLRLALTAEFDAVDAALHLDLYDADAADAAHLAGTTACDGCHAARLEFRSDHGATLVAVLQPTADGAATYRLGIERTAALLLPVHGAEPAAIRGHFHDRREGGARLHRGVDIFAARGTAVLAAAAGVIAAVDETAIGGLVIWLDEHDTGRSHYYAHLGNTLVRTGDHVDAGAQIGTVGTSGNAAGTPPHLHFGVYIDGDAVDPVQLLPAAAAAPAPRDPLCDVPCTAIVRLAGTAFRATTAQHGPAHTLRAGERVTVLATGGRLARVRLADGRDGFVANWLLAAPSDR